MNLYRVIPFRRLQQMADQKALAFVSYRSFKDDPHEASLIRALMTQDGVREVSKALAQRGQAPSSPLMLIMAARAADASAFMQCWTKTPEHNLMWERYGDGDQAVRITMNEAGQSNLPPWISSHEARYEDEFDISKEIENVYSSLDSNSGIIDFRQSLTFKLKAYHHENEIRLMTPIHNAIVPPGKPHPQAPWVNHPDGNKNVSLVPIGDVKNIVASVMSGPRATDEFQREVEDFCKLHGMAYEGKSLLMTPRFSGSKKIFTSDPDDAA